MGNCHNNNDTPSLQEGLTAAASYITNGESLMRQKLYRNAAIYFQKAHDIQLQQLSCMDIRLVETYSNLALTHRFQGNHNDALRLLVKALKVCEHNKNQLKALDVYLYVGEVYVDSHQYEEAMRTFEHALTEAKNSGNEQCPVIGSIAFKVALIYKKQENYTKSFEYLDQALNVYVENFGEDHSLVADCYNLMGLIHKKQHNFKAALKYYKKALCLRERNLSSEHHDLATSYNNIALVLKESQRFAEALEYLEKCVRIEIETFGAHHARVEATMKSVTHIIKMLPKDAQDFENHFTRILTENDMKMLSKNMSLSPKTPSFETCGKSTKASFSTMTSFRMSCL